MRCDSIFILLAAFLALGPGPVRASPPAPHDFRILQSDRSGLRVAWEHEDTSGVASYRIRVSDSSGVHRDMASWNGHDAAFSFTTDDGRRENLAWAAACLHHGVSGTFFCVPGFLGDPGYLTEGEILALDSLGMEIGCHSMTHARLVTDEAFRLRYVGGAETCSLRIWDGYLQTYVADSLDLSVDLNAPPTKYLFSLCDEIDRRPDYECLLDFYVCTDDFCRSNYLEWVRGERIDHDWYQARTVKGLDSLGLESEVAGGKAFFDSLIDRPGYTCRSFAYPHNLHDEREMAACLRAGFLGARDGYPGQIPFGAPRGPDDRFNVNLYEKEGTYQVSLNGLSEAETRAEIRGLVEEWCDEGRWACLRTYHTLADIDSAHLAWVLDEVLADGNVWVAPFGEVAEYARRYAINVGKPPRKEASLFGLEPGVWHYAVVTALGRDGEESPWSNEIAFMPPAPTGVEPPLAVRPEAPVVRFLGSSPDPGTGSVGLWLSLREPSPVEVFLYNVAGREVARIDAGPLGAGSQRIGWNGASPSGRPLAAGRYFVVLRAGPSVGKGSALLVR